MCLYTVARTGGTIQGVGGFQKEPFSEQGTLSQQSFHLEPRRCFVIRVPLGFSDRKPCFHRTFEGSSKGGKMGRARWDLPV